MLRNKVATMLVVGLAVMAATAAAASSASAAFELSLAECNTGPKWGLCWSTTATSELKELIGTEEVAAKSKTAALFVVPSIPFEIECKTDANAGFSVISQTEPLGTAANTLAGKVVFKECLLVGKNTVAERCVIPAEKETNELLAETTSATTMRVTPKSSTVFIEFPLSSKSGQTCPATVIGTRKTTGSQELTIGTREEGKFTLSAVAKSGLLFIEKAAELTGTSSISLVNVLTDWVGAELT